jgi:hypothetical protein
MLLRHWAWILIGMSAAGCVDVEPVEITCPGLVHDGGVIEVDGGETPDGGAVDACQPAIEPLDACDNEGEITNTLDGTCWWEQCRDGERSLFRKIAGVPCVYRPSGGNSEWAIGACGGDGVCTGGFIDGPK